MDRACSNAEVDLALKAASLELFTEILGPPNKALTTRRTAAWGRQGSLKLEIAGPKAGAWKDHEAGDGGYPFHLILFREVGGSRDDPQAKAKAWAWARNWLGWSASDGVQGSSRLGPNIEKRLAEIARQEAEKAKERAEKIGRARQLWAGSIPVVGTLADRYLRSIRKIPADTWPETVAFHPGERALIVKATDANGDVQGVQLVYLTPDARNLKEGEPPKQRNKKRSYGPQNGATIRLPGLADGPVCAAEGPETGLSAWAATGFETWIALGSTSKITPPEGRRVILLVDDDNRHAPSFEASRKTLRDWLAAGVDVVEATPWERRREDKSDFNDLMKESGPEAVRERIERAAGIGTAIRQRLVTLEDARALLEARTSEFFANAQAHPHGSEEAPPVHGLGVTLGGGKTHASIEAINKSLHNLRSKGDNRAVVIAVPQHKLAEEIASRFRLLGTGYQIEIRRGREARNPASDDQTMCVDLETAREAQRLSVDVEAEVCSVCPHAASCAYLAQKGKDADVWIVSHAMPFLDAPAAISRRGIVALVIDESPVQAGLIGVEGSGIKIPLAMLEPNRLPLPNTLDSYQLETNRLLLKQALDGLPDGFVPRAALASVGFDEQTGKTSRALEYKRKVLPKHVKNWRDREDNRSLGQMAALWSSVEKTMALGANEVSGSLSLEYDRQEGVRYLRVSGRQDVAADWRVPTLLIDAFLDEQALAHFWPQIRVTARIDIETPHMRVKQATMRAFSKSKLAPSKNADPTDTGEISKANARRKLEARIVRVARENGGETLVVSNKATMDALHLPAHIQRAHFNAVAGLDRFGTARTIVVIGRPQPSPGATERLAGALTGRAPSVSLRNADTAFGFDWYPRQDAFRRVREGKDIRLVPTQVDAHPDETCERIRSGIAEAEVMQAIGRGRGVQRGPESPLDVIVLTDCVLPIPVDEIISDAPFTQRTLADEMLAMGGVAFEDAGAAFAAYPGFWPNYEAAKKAMQRDSALPVADESLALVQFKRAGNGRRMSHAVVDLKMVADAHATLEAMLGALAHFEIINASAEPETADTVSATITILAEVVADETSVRAPLPPGETPQIIDLVLIRDAARDRGMTEGEIDKAAGVSLPHFSNARHGQRRLKPEIEERLAEVIQSIPPVQRLLF